ncbi:hypothetical protein G9A89_023817 [Geosiphon pyriformis]|nr:hypothetical protein G9A89_023817 [Geosiphon pyriformis]
MESQRKDANNGSPCDQMEDSELRTGSPPEVHSLESPATTQSKTKRSKWDSESDIEETEERLPTHKAERKKRPLKKGKALVGSDAEEYKSKPEVTEEARQFQVAADGSFLSLNPFPLRAPVSGDEEAAETKNSSPVSRNEATPQLVVDKITRRVMSTLPKAPVLAGCRSVDNYEKLNRIEEGAYGVVFRARDKSTGEIVALKKLKLDKEKNGFPITSLREVATLLSAKHPNIVNVREIVVGETLTQVFIVMDFVEHDLKSLMEDMHGPFLHSEIKTIMLQLLSAVAMLHDNWIIHRDLKTSNLLLNNRGQIKVADFGLARSYGSPLGKMTELVVTLWYRAPELLLGVKKYSTAIDIWSVGCIFGELVNKEPLLPGRSEIDQLDKIIIKKRSRFLDYWELRMKGYGQGFHYCQTPGVLIWLNSLIEDNKLSLDAGRKNHLRSRFPYLSENGIDLMSKMLTYDPAKRITAEEALKHPYFIERPAPKDPEMFPTWPSKGGGERRKSYASPSAPKAAHGEIDEDDQALWGSIFENQGTADRGFRLKFENHRD